MKIIYSPGYGAGMWGMSNELRCDPKLIKLIEEKNLEEAVKYVVEKNDDLYLGGLENAVVEDVPKGTKFKIDEYDGYESIEYFDEDLWMVAK